MPVVALRSIKFSFLFFSLFPGASTAPHLAVSILQVTLEFMPGKVESVPARPRPRLGAVTANGSLGLTRFVGIEMSFGADVFSVFIIQFREMEWLS